MENNFNFPDKLYSFTKIQGAIKTWTLDKNRPITEFTALYFSNYGESSVFTKSVIAEYYFVKEEDCFVAWVEALEKKKEQIIKRFEKKFKRAYYSPTEEKLNKFIKDNWHKFEDVPENFKP